MDKQAYPPVRKAHATVRPAASTPTDDVGFAHVRPAMILPILLAVAGCSGAGGGSQVSNASTNELVDSDSFAVDMESAWTGVSPDLIFDAKSPAQFLPRPRGLTGAQLGFYDDPAMVRQYSRKQLSEMRRDGAGFTIARDLDGDGIAEIYRTGFWRIGKADSDDVRKGTFLAVFDRRRPPQIVDSTGDEGDGIFLSGGRNGIYVAGCNCRWQGEVGYKGKRLTVTWSG